MHKEERGRYGKQFSGGGQHRVRRHTYIAADQIAEVFTRSSAGGHGLAGTQADLVRRLRWLN